MMVYSVKFMNMNGLFIDQEFFVGESKQECYELARAYYPELIVGEMEYISAEES